MDKNRPTSSSVNEDVVLASIKQEKNSPNHQLQQQQLFLQHLAPDEYELDRKDEGDEDKHNENENDDELCCDCAKCTLQREKQALVDIKGGVYDAENNIVYVDDNADEEDFEEEYAQKDDTENQSSSTTISGETETENSIDVSSNTNNNIASFFPISKQPSISTSVDGKNQNIENAVLPTRLQLNQPPLSKQPHQPPPSSLLRQLLQFNPQHLTSPSRKRHQPTPTSQILYRNEPTNKRNPLSCDLCPSYRKQKIYLYPKALQNHYKQKHGQKWLLFKDRQSVSLSDPYQQLTSTFITTPDTLPETTLLRPTTLIPTESFSLETSATKLPKSSVNLDTSNESSDEVPSKQRTHKLYCPFCGKFFSDCSRFVEHKDNKNCVLPEVFLAEKDAQLPYTCLKCSLAFANLVALDEHLCCSL